MLLTVTNDNMPGCDPTKVALRGAVAMTCGVRRSRGLVYSGGWGEDLSNRLNGWNSQHQTKMLVISEYP